MFFFKIIAIVLAVYGSLSLLLFVFQSRLIFLPVRSLILNPGDTGLDFRDLWIPSGNARIHAWHVPAKRSRCTVLFFHGNGGNLSHRLDTILLLHRMNCSVVIFDYRGYGKSEGRPGESHCYEDGEAVYRYVRERLGTPGSKYVFWGRSLGGAVAAETALRHPPFALILESTFTSVPDMASRLYPGLPVRLLCRHRFDVAARVSALSVPKLFIHSPEDEIVPFALGRRLFSNAAPPKEFLEIRGDHNSGFLESGETYTRGIAAFLDSLAPEAHAP